MQKFLAFLWEHRAAILRAIAAILAAAGVLDAQAAQDAAPQAAAAGEPMVFGMAQSDALVVGAEWGGALLAMILSFFKSTGGMAAIDTAMAGVFKVIRGKGVDPNVRLVAGVTLSSACIEISAGNPAAIALAEQWRAKFLEGPEVVAVETRVVTLA